MTDTTKNQGEGTRRARPIASTCRNASYDLGDVSLAAAPPPPWQPAGEHTATPLTIPAGTPPGAYYLVARADADGVVAEIHETNNVRVRSITIVP